MVVGRGPLRSSSTSRGARLSRHAAPEPPQPPARAVGATATATPTGDRRGARAWLLLALACAALLIAAPVAIVMSPTSPDGAGRDAEVYTPSDLDGGGSGDAATGDDGGTGAVQPTAAPLPDGAVPPVPSAPGGSAGTGGTGWTAGTGGTAGSAPRTGGGSGWTQPGTSPIAVLPSSPPASSNPPASQPPANQPSGGYPTGGTQTGGTQTGGSQTGGTKPPPPSGSTPTPAREPSTDCLCQVLEPVKEPLEDVVTGTTGAVGGLLGR